MSMKSPSIAIVHYSAPPVVGGVEAVIQAHAQVFRKSGHQVRIVAGRGESQSLPAGCEFHRIPEMDSQHPRVVEVSKVLEKGNVPEDFRALSDKLMMSLEPIVSDVDYLFLHNLFTKHFNLPLTDALFRLLDKQVIRSCIAWCHDFTWASPYSRSKVHPGYPWDMIRTKRSDTTYVVVSRKRQAMLAELFDCPLDEIKVIYNGVNPKMLFGISDEIEELIARLDLFNSDLIVSMPVRITRAKNIEFALRVVASLKSRGCRPKLVLTGPPDPHDAQNMFYFRELRELRSQLNVEGEMHFVYESGPKSDQGYIITTTQVGELLRVSDLMFMPSHREGFGMPVLEAGLLGIPVMTTNVPAAVEIGSEDIVLVENPKDPIETADQIIEWLDGNPMYRLRRRVRQQYTWEAIYHSKIRPLLQYVNADR
jgi:glycosyltransferase involved in cell wall biosynthesis